MEWVKKNVITLIIIILSASFSIATAYQILNSDIKIISIFGKETRKIVVTHIEYTKGEPLTELEMTLTVKGLGKEVDELVISTGLNTEGRFLHDKNMAVQALQNTVILEKLDLLINK